MYEIERIVFETNKSMIACAAYADTLIKVLDEKGVISQSEVEKRADYCLKAEGIYADKIRELDQIIAMIDELEKNPSGPLMKNLFADALNRSDNEGKKAPTYIRNCSCGNCDKTDGMCYTSLPPKVKCTITGKFHLYGDTCDVLAEEG